MSNAIKLKAVYKEGVLVPFEKIDLKEGEKVELEIKSREGRKNISLRGIWKEFTVKEDDIAKVKFIWEKGIKKQINILIAKKDNVR